MTPETLLQRTVTEMPGSMLHQQDSFNRMYDYPSNLDYSLQQIPYACPDPGYEYTNSSDCLQKVRVNSGQQAKQASRPVPLQPSVLPVPDLNDVDALISKPCSSANAFFDTDPRFQLFAQRSDYDKLSGSYVNEPLGSFYPNELNGELSHTLSEAWRFNPFALSNRNARETAAHLARTPRHGLSRGAASWIRSSSLSRQQAQTRDREADDVAAKKCSMWERYVELDDGNPCAVNDDATLQQVLDDFYESPIGADPNKLRDHHCYNTYGPHSALVGPLPFDDKEVFYRPNGHSLGTKSARISLPARRGWLGGIPTPVSTTGPSKHSGVREDRGYGATSLPTPDSGTVSTTADASERPAVDQASSLISPPLTGVSSAPASHNHLGVMISRDYPPQNNIRFSSAYTPETTTFLVNQTNHQNHAFAAADNEPTFNAKLAPLRRPKQTGRPLALFGNNGECEWRGRTEGPYDFSEFCSEKTDLSDASERTAGSGGITSVSPTNSTMSKFDGDISMPDANDVDDGILQGTITPVATADNSIINLVGSETLFGYSSSRTPINPLNDAHPEELSSGHSRAQTTLRAHEDISDEIRTPRGTPARAKILAQDLEQSIHSAVSQTASLARNISQPSPLFLPQPVVAIPKPQDPKKDGDYVNYLIEPSDEQLSTQIVETASEQDYNKSPQTDPITGGMQTEYIRDESHPFPVNTFTTPETRRAHNIQSANLMKPTAIHLTPEYSSIIEDDVSAGRHGLTTGVPSSPTNEAQGGRNDLTNYTQGFSSNSSLNPHKGIEAGVEDADPSTNDPEDMALTPTHAEFDLDNLTPNDPLEAVSLIEESTNSTTTTGTPNSTPSAVFNAFQHSHTPNMAPAYSPYLKAFSPTSSSYYTPAAAAPALAKPIYHVPLIKSPRTPYQLSTASRTPALVLPLATPGTPTPSPKASSQHHRKKLFGSTLKHKDPSVEAKLQQKARKSVKNVFKSKALGSRTPSPSKEAAGQDPFVIESGQGSIEATVKRTTQATPTHAAPIAVMTAKTPSQDEAIVSNSLPIARTTSQDRSGQAVAVKNKRKQKQSTGEEGQNQKKPRRSTPTVEHEAVEMSNGVLLS